MWKQSTLPSAFPKIQGTDAADPSLPQPGRYSRVHIVSSTYSTVKRHQKSGPLPSRMRKLVMLRVCSAEGQGKSYILQHMHHLWCEAEKDSASCWFAKHFKTRMEKRISNAGEDLWILKGMAPVVTVKQNCKVSVHKVPLNDAHSYSSQNFFIPTTAQIIAL